METGFVEALEVELKYCERCGGLWLRPLGMEEIYCPACIPLMADLPLRRKRVSVITAHAKALEGECQEVFAICGEGGHA